MGLQLLQELSDEELDRIERRSEAATVGPWYSYVVGRDSDAVVDCIELGSCNELGSCGIIELAGASVADQDFIAHARQDLPRLLREVRTLRERMRSLGSGQGRQAVPGEGDGGALQSPVTSHAAQSGQRF